MTSILRALCLGCLCVSLSLCGCGEAPESRSEEAEKAVDALYTAVTSRRPDLVKKMETHFATLHEEGKLSDDELEVVTDIMTQANSGKWDEAAEQLDAMIRARNE